MTQVQDGDAVERLYLRLADALQSSRHGGFDSPISVAEIYQELVPYRVVRNDVGFAMNADYEHALLRLLAGEGGYVRVEPEKAKAELRRELETTNPNLGLYREFAGCDAWVTAPEDGFTDGVAGDAGLPWLEEVAEDDAAAPADDWSSLTSLADDGAVDDVAEPSPMNTFAFAEQEPAQSAAPPATARRAAVPAVPAVAGPDATTPPEVHCAFCDSALPTHRPVRFCPFCGADQQTRPCGECGEKIEPGWAFCVACGASRS